MNARHSTFNFYETNVYRLHLYQSLGGMKFIVMSDKKVDCLVPQLRQFYTDIYVKYVAMNIMMDRENCLSNTLIVEKITEYLNNLPGRW